jgi:hypothetical protein
MFLAKALFCCTDILRGKLILPSDPLIFRKVK